MKVVNHLFILFFYLGFGINHCYSQEIIPFQANEKCGFIVKDESGKVISHVNAQFNELKIHAEHILNIGSSYMDYRDTLWSNFVDTVYTDKTCHNDSSGDCYIIDTSINYGRKYYNKSIIASQNKWGLIDFKGNIILPFIYDSILIYGRYYRQYCEDPQNKFPYLILFKNNKMAVCDNKGKFTLNEKTQQIINKNISVKVKYEILDFTLIGKYLVVAKDAVYYDSSYIKIIDNATMNIVNNDTIYNHKFIPINNKGFIGGSYNVLNLETGKYLFEKWQKKVLVKISSKDNNFDILDITNGDSIEHFINFFRHAEDLEFYNISFESSK